MRVATFNVLHGRSLADGLVDPSRLAAAVRELDPDVLALQEVDRDQPRSHGADLTAIAAEAMGAVAWRFVPALIGTPDGSWPAAVGVEPPGAPAYGIALLSRHPVRSWQVLRLPVLPIRVPLRFRGSRPVLVRDEPRVAVVAEVQAPAGGLTVAATHLSFVRGWNAVQLRALRQALDGAPEPLVLLGDLNLSLRTARLVSGMRPLAVGPTFPADAPRRQIDHVLGRGVGSAAAARTHALSLSDHRALSVEVTVPAASAQPTGR